MRLCRDDNRNVRNFVASWQFPQPIKIFISISDNPYNYYLFIYLFMCECERNELRFSEDDLFALRTK